MRTSFRVVNYYSVTVMGLSTCSPPKPRKPLRGRFPFETLKRKIMELKKRYHPSTLLIRRISD